MRRTVYASGNTFLSVRPSKSAQQEATSSACTATTPSTATSTAAPQPAMTLPRGTLPSLDFTRELPVTLLGRVRPFPAVSWPGVSVAAADRAAHDARPQVRVGHAAPVH